MIFLQTSDAPLFPMTVTAHKIHTEHFQSRACYARQNPGQICDQTVTRVVAGHLEASQAVIHPSHADACAARLRFKGCASTRREGLEARD
jgi:hypothetical protein